MKRLIKILRNDVRGSTMIEYAILASLISVVAVGAVTTVGTDINSTFETVGTKLAAANR